MIPLSLSHFNSHRFAVFFLVRYHQSDFTGVASALIRMGATTGPVDEVKFGKELQIVIEKVTQMAPDIIVASTPDGTR